MNIKFRKISIGIRGFYVVFFNEIHAFFRNKGMFLSMTLQPILYFGFMVIGINASIGGTIYYLGRNIPYSAYAIVGVISLLMTTQMSQAMYRSTVDKQYGLLALKFLNGIRPGFYILGMSTFPALGYLYQSIILLTLGIASGVIQHMPFLPFAMIIGLVMLIFWTSLGIIISTKINNYQRRDIITTLLFTPLAFTAPSFYSLDHSPRIIQVISYMNPMTYQISALRSIAVGKFNWLYLGISISFSVLSVILAVMILDRMELTFSER
ncbi:MAG: ABC transporter permease [Sporolactobacillus sp.]|jgi:ABC-2 type transport system permease protein|nr:ABC transporter permease [Sporolactobacillus sp.]